MGGAGQESGAAVKAASALLALTVAACASAQDWEGAQDAASSAYISCVYASARRLALASREAADVVAVAAAQACPRELAALRQAYELRFNPPQVVVLMANAERSAGRGAVAQVVGVRAARTQ